MIQKQAIKLNKVVRFVRNALAFFTPEVGDYLVNVSYQLFLFFLPFEPQDIYFVLPC